MKTYKYLFFASLVVLILMGCAIALMRYLWSDANKKSMDFAQVYRYAEANRELLQAPVKNYRVVFMGNSITEFWMNMHPEFFTENGYVSRGIAGQVTSQMLLRFREDVLELSPEVLVLHAGVNDIAENAGPYDEAYTLGNIQTMVELAEAHGIKVIIASILPSNHFFWHPDLTDGAVKIAALNRKIQAYAESKGIPYVNYYEKMVYGEELAMNPAYSDDGTHPTQAGYDLMEPMIKAVIDQTLNSGNGDGDEGTTD